MRRSRTGSGAVGGAGDAAEGIAAAGSTGSSTIRGGCLAGRTSGAVQVCAEVCRKVYGRPAKQAVLQSGKQCTLLLQTLSYPETLQSNRNVHNSETHEYVPCYRKFNTSQATGNLSNKGVQGASQHLGRLVHHANESHARGCLVLAKLDQ